MTVSELISYLQRIEQEYQLGNVPVMIVESGNSYSVITGIEFSIHSNCPILNHVRLNKTIYQMN